MTVFSRIYQSALTSPSAVALLNRDAEGKVVSTTYEQLLERVNQTAHGLRSVGVGPGTHVGVVADNRPEWLYCNLALMGLGAVDVPMGTDITRFETDILLNHANCSLCIVETPEIAERMFEFIPHEAPLSHIVIMAPGEYHDPDEAAASEGEHGADTETGEEYEPVINRVVRRGQTSGVSVVSLEEMCRLGEEHETEEARNTNRPVLGEGTEDTPATILYTSGTTGEPKGVVLTHRSFLFQCERVPEPLKLQPGHIVMITLPVWQSFERSTEYVVLAAGATIAYSKPMLPTINADLVVYKPHYVTAVPRIWEGLQRSYQNEISGPLKSVLSMSADRYARVADRMLGRRPVWGRRSDILRRLSLLPLWVLLLFPGYLGRFIAFRALRRRFGAGFRAGVSGGGAMPRHTDRFFRAAGLTLLESYGLTECGALLAMREWSRPVVGTVGRLFRDIESRIVDESGAEVKVGQRGVLHIRSESVMAGYHKSPTLTGEVYNWGWLNTGDIVMRSRRNELCILGRAKDTIILLGGENVEPEPIEQRLTRSSLIKDAMVVGQDRRFLGALILVEPEPARALLREHGEEPDAAENINLRSSVLQNKIRQEIAEAVSAGGDYRLHEQIYRFSLLDRPFEAPEELTHTGKKRRSVIERHFKDQIERMYN